ncbi:hypothetical protein F5X96DRAFT_646791 [Biscogniauxia mediterranea]|nr:hypothetical protein F5X96DRAFT_646791 [Biscogniauxia mediterranea]
MSDVSTGWGGAWCAYSRMSRDHDKEFFDEARRRRDAAIARGDDPYADFREMVGNKGGDARLERAWRRIMEDADTEDTMKEAYVDSREQGLAANASRNSYYHEPMSPTTSSSSSSRDATKRKSVWRKLFSRRRKHHD